MAVPGRSRSSRAALRWLMSPITNGKADSAEVQLMTRFAMLCLILCMTACTTRAPTEDRLRADSWRSAFAEEAAVGAAMIRDLRTPNSNEVGESYANAYAEPILARIGFDGRLYVAVRLVAVKGIATDRAVLLRYRIKDGEALLHAHLAGSDSPILLEGPSMSPPDSFDTTRTTVTMNVAGSEWSDASHEHHLFIQWYVGVPPEKPAPATNVRVTLTPGVSGIVFREATLQTGLMQVDNR